MSEIELKLKPCPFCGGKAKLKKGFPYQQNNHTKYAFVQCTKCRAKSGTNQQYPFEAYEDMIKFTVRDWNERAERCGEWTRQNSFIPVCSECGCYVSKEVYNPEDAMPPFCPHCGAKMYEKDGENNA